ncbi:hypothetical protein QYE76_000803 [Lolium multiflorum]|uniref:CCHC-type domain-containing protein n=1 Tax=Lolium multiflorum TaxID=4521 RepID=A0AAD8RIG5_LOLMU|nr:hypothetical protein QYE76_000803 [Lolium multiflorum]
MTYQWESYQLGPEGDLKFEKELKQLVDYLGHPYPKFFGIPLKAKSGEPPQWDVSTDLRKKLDAPMVPPTRNNSRAQANQIHIEHAKMTDAINILAMERKALRHQHAKKDYLIARLRVKIASLEQLIPIPHHTPRAKSDVTCYACGVTGHYSNKCPMKAANNAPRTGSNAVPIAQTNKSTVTCYECGTVGHYSNECPKKLAKTAANPAALHSSSAISPPEGSLLQTTRTTATTNPCRRSTRPRRKRVAPRVTCACRGRRTRAHHGQHRPRVASPQHTFPGPKLCTLSFAVAAPTRLTRTRALAPLVADDHFAGSPQPCRQNVAVARTHQTVPHLASKRPSTASTSPSDCLPRRPDSLAGDAAMMSPCRTPHGHLAPYKYTASRAFISTPNLLPSLF